MGRRPGALDALRSFFEGDWRPIGEGWEVRHRPGVGTTVRGRVAKSKVPAIRDFFERDLRPEGPVRVRGAASSSGTAPRLVFSGEWTPFATQRARNFLIQHLY